MDAEVAQELVDLRAQVAALREEVARLKPSPVTDDWISGSAAATILKICRVRKLPLLVRAKLLVVKHGKFSRLDVQRLKERGVPTFAELRNAVAAVEQPPVQRRRRSAQPAPAARVMDWRPPAT